MTEDPRNDRLTASFEEMAYSNMIVVESLVQLLVEKGLLDQAEIIERVKEVRAKTTINSKRKQ
ncbi:MAG TPA: hypothetical protein VN822_05205 [Candidatus Acidoferrales bacterium]|nr:hypothetical protein [Candidatus Acidoferrales bacterium]